MVAGCRSGCAAAASPLKRFVMKTGPGIPPAADVAREDAPLLVADIGGTHARLALVRNDADGGIGILAHQQYDCSAFPSLAGIVADFLSRSGGGRVHDAAIGCAGMHRGDTVTSLNLPWPVSLSELRGLGIARVAAVNDFVAVAHAVQCLGPDHSVLLCGPEEPVADGPGLVVGPGTGLGAAYRIPCDGRILVLPSEAGQMAFAPGNARELAVLGQLFAAAAGVACTEIVSGPGLLTLYGALCALDGEAVRRASPAEVVAAARQGDDRQALEAVEMFCAVLGATIGNLAVAGIATRVHVAGGIVPRIREFLPGSQFRARFVGTGTGIMRAALEQIPVRLIDHPHQGVIGAAVWYQQRGQAQAGARMACASI